MATKRKPTSKPRLDDPREQDVPQPFPKQKQAPPGLEAKMHPRPDYGEDSWKGLGRLKGRRAFITGGDSGIGRATALAFAREGADVAIGYLEPDEKRDADEAVAAIEKTGHKCLRVPGDVREPKQCQAMVKRVVKELGGIDILVNNAAFQMTHDDIADITPEELDRVFRTNVYAMFYLCQAAIPHMKPGSSIINTASVQAFKPSPELLHYACTKAAQVNFTKGLAQMVADKGIRVNAVAPGPVWTPLIPASDMDTTKFGLNTLFKRAAQPVELAPLYVFLASNEASYVTGMVYGATGRIQP